MNTQDTRFPPLNPWGDFFFLLPIPLGKKPSTLPRVVLTPLHGHSSRVVSHLVQSSLRLFTIKHIVVLQARTIKSTINTSSNLKPKESLTIDYTNLGLGLENLSPNLHWRLEAWWCRWSIKDHVDEDEGFHSPSLKRTHEEAPKIPSPSSPSSSSLLLNLSL